jgi:hypothetical protein
MTKTNLYSYSLRIDDGAAPNPFGGVCTLAICKPAIRRTAEVGDWIVGLGTKRAPDGRDLSLHVAYAMEVTDKMSLREYDRYCLKQLPIKIPKWQRDLPFGQRVGDCLYAYADGVKEPVQRPGVHNHLNIPGDLSGDNALLGARFYYFGDATVALPEDFQRIAHPYQGHKVRKNMDIAAAVIKWLLNGCGGDYQPGVLYGRPLHRHLVENKSTSATWSTCAKPRRVDDHNEFQHIC